MATTATIRQLLVSFSVAGDLTSLNNLIASLTPAEVDAVGPATWTQTLLNVSSVFLSGTQAEVFQAKADSVRALMSKAAYQIPAAFIGSEMTQFAGEGNIAALDALTDFLTSSQVEGISPSFLGNTLSVLTGHPGLTAAQEATAVRDFMVKFGPYVPVGNIGFSLVNFAAEGNTAGIDAVTDNLLASQVSAIDPSALGTVLTFLAGHPSLSATQEAAAVRDFMLKLDPYVPVNSIAQAMVTFASEGNTSALDAVTDYLLESQKSALNPASLGVTLTYLVGHPGLSASSQTSAVRNLMQKLGVFVPAADIGSAITRFAFDGNVGGLDAVTDYLLPSQASAIPPANLGTALLALTGHPGLSNTQESSAVSNLMSKLGPYVPAADIGNALQTFAIQGNVGGLDAILVYLLESQKSAISPNILGNTLTALAGHPGLSALTEENAIRSLMSRIGVYVPVASIGNAMQILAGEANVGALDAVTDYLSAGQITAISATQLGTTLLFLAGHPSLSALQESSAVDDLMTKLGSRVPVSSISSALQIFLGAANYDGIDALLSNLSSAQYGAIPSSVISQLTGSGITLGSFSGNTIVGNGSANIMFGLDGGDSLQGLGGNDKLFAGSGNDNLYGGTGNDLLAGGKGNDLYVFNRGDGSDTIRDHDETSGNADRLSFGIGVENDQLWFTQSGNDLVIQIIGTTDKVTIDNWYDGSADRVEKIMTNNGVAHTLTAGKVQNLVNAMAGLAVPSTTTLSAAYHAQLDGVIAANWT